MLDAILAPIMKWTTGVISAGGYTAVAGLMAIESCSIPLPSELIMPFAGFLVHKGEMNLFWASIAGAFGCMVGSAVNYWVGAVGGRPFIEKYGRYVLIRKKDLDRADRWFEKWGLWATFIARMLPIIRTFISFPAGVSRVPFIPFLILAFVGSVPWCYMLGLVGLKLGENWTHIRDYLHGFDLIIALVLLGLFAFWLYHHLKPEKDEEQKEAA